MGDAMGEVKETLGMVTGDREVEAEGRLEQQGDDESADEAKEEVRKDHRDVP